jgi:hypothetical protein
MYPRLADWLAVRRRVDPNGVLRSDLSRRLAIATEATSPNSVATRSSSDDEPTKAGK